MESDKRPLAPWKVALLTWVGIVVIGSIVFTILIPSGPGSTARMEKGMEGLGTLSVIIAVAVYFGARSRQRAWDQRQSEAARRERVAGRTKEGPFSREDSPH